MEYILFYASGFCAAGLWIMSFVNLLTGFIDRSRMWQLVRHSYIAWTLFYFTLACLVAIF
jgi:hypothetical protein